MKSIFIYPFLVAVLIIFINGQAFGQSVSRIQGQNCTSATQVFQLQGCSNCSNFNWYITGTYGSVTGQTNSAVSFIWTVAQQNVSVSVSYIQNGYSYSQYSSNYTICNSCSGAGAASISGVISPSCSGQAMTLVAGGGTSPVWSTGATTSSIGVSPTSSTTYSVTVTESSCNTRVSAYAGINIVGAVSITSSYYDVCQGSVLNYTASAANATSYNWSISPSNAGSFSGGQLTVSASYSGTATVSVNANGCTSTSTTLVVDKKPGTQTLNGPSGLCSGQTIDIHLAGSENGFHYQLYSSGYPTGNTIVGTGSQLDMGTVGPGSYQVYGSNNNCSAIPVSQILTITSMTAAPLTIGISGEPSWDDNSPYVCSGDAVILTPQNGDASSYSWSSSPYDASATGSGSITIHPVDGQSYTLYGNDNVCHSPTQSSPLVFHVAGAVGQVTLSPSSASVCQGTSSPSVFTTGSTANIGSYGWSISPSNAGSLSSSISNGIGTLNVTWAPSFSGTVTVSVTAFGGTSCSKTTGASATVAVVATPPSPTVANQSALFNSNYSLSASGATGGQIYKWYNSADLNNALGSNVVGPLNTQTSYNYDVSLSQSGCEGPKVPFTVSLYVNAPPSPTATTNTCGAKTLVPGTAPPLVTYYLQTNATGQDTSTPLGSSYVLNNTGQYWVNAKANTIGLWSPSTVVSVPASTVEPVDLTVYTYDAANPIVQATHSITLKPGFYAPYGNTLDAKIVITPECNDLVNWVENIVYDQNGNIVSDSRTYADGFGNAVESEAKDPVTGSVITSQTLFNSYNVAAGATLPAPILENDFIYKPAFSVNGSGQPYSASDFDQRANLNAQGGVYNPNPQGTSAGTVGWYYSTLNDLEPQTPITQFPYSRSFTPEGPDPTSTSAAGPGNQLHMGTGHESKSDRYLINSGELDNYYTLRSSYSVLSSSTTPANLGYKYVSTDANGKQSATFVDADGRTVASALIVSGSGGNFTYSNWSYSYYNDLGQLTASVAPNGVTGTTSMPNFVTYYYYDQLGRLIKTTSPDEGTSQFVYSTDGKIRFSQNQEQATASTPRFSYTHYDKLGRPIESGEYTNGAFIFEPASTASPASNSVLNIVDVTGYSGATGNLNVSGTSDVTQIFYDTQASDLPTGDNAHSQQNYLVGQISKTTNANATTWYNYDEFGQVAWTKQNINGFAAKTVDYTYDYFGNVTQVAYQAGQPDQFYHYYTYDANQRLTKVTTSVDGSTQTLQAKYYYYLHGPLKRVELAGNLQGIDYVYNIDGTLKSINHADATNDPGNDGSNGFSPDVFGQTLTYYDGDYSGAGYSAGSYSSSGLSNNYNGLLKSTAWFTPVDGTTPGTKMYGYTYDNLNRFSNAQWGTATGAAGNYLVTSPQYNAYNEAITGYDNNGNIAGLNRTGKTGNSMASYGYVYPSTTNQLSKVNNNGSAQTTYSYNTIGQMTQQVEASTNTTMKVAYNAYGLTKQVTDANGNLMVTYAYDDRGDRVQQVIYNGGTQAKTTYYVRDASGNVLAAYVKTTAAPVLAEVPIYGAGRIGMMKPKGGQPKYFYEINDHLGNVRAVIGPPTTDQVVATMEAGNATVETKEFENITQTRVSPYSAPGQTDGGNSAARLNNGQSNGGYYGQVVGPGRYIPVSPGDVITATVYGYYEGGSGYSTTIPVATMVAAVAATFTSLLPVGEFGTLQSSLTHTFGSGFAGALGSSNDNVPAAYLNMIMLDGNMLTDAALPSSAIPISSAANGHLEQLTIGPINITEPGYVYIYVSDNSDSPNWVYFDDLTITHAHSPYVAGGDFYPFGLPMEDRQMPSEPYRYGYQGQYSEKDSITNWNAFELRMYDPDKGRWLSPDPYGQFSSPYVAMGNNPVSGADPDGGLCCEELGEAFAMAADEEMGVSIALSRSANASLTASVFDGMGGGYQIEFGNSLRMPDPVANMNLSIPSASDLMATTSGVTGSPVMGTISAPGFGESLIPIWGSGREAAAAFSAGNYWQGAFWTGMAVSDVFMVKALATVAVKSVASLAARSSTNLWRVGAYNELRGLEAGLDAHHVGQKAIMQKLIPGYNARTAPAILVPKLGHTLGSGGLSRVTLGFTNARQVLARDILELRRVHPNIPNSSLQELIRLNKFNYPGAFVK